MQGNNMQKVSQNSSVCYWYLLFGHGVGVVSLERITKTRTSEWRIAAWDRTRIYWI